MLRWVMPLPFEATARSIGNPVARGHWLCAVGVDCKINISVEPSPGLGDGVVGSKINLLVLDGFP